MRCAPEALTTAERSPESSAGESDDPETASDGWETLDKTIAPKRAAFHSPLERRTPTDTKQAHGVRGARPDRPLFTLVISPGLLPAATGGELQHLTNSGV